MDFAEKLVSQKALYHGHVIQLDLEQVTLPNGEPAKREVIHHPGAAAIMPFLPDGRMIFVEQWRQPLRQVTYEIPAGKLDQRDQTPLHAAWRELNEETGYTAARMEPVNTFFSSPGFADEKMYLYQAIDLKPVAEQLPQDADEFIQLHALTLDEALAKQQAGVICDAKTIIAVQQWQIMTLQEAMK